MQSNQNRAKLNALLLINSNITEREANGFSAVCFSKSGYEYLSKMFKDRNINIDIENKRTVPLILDRGDKINRLISVNPSIRLLIDKFELE